MIEVPKRKHGLTGEQHDLRYITFPHSGTRTVKRFFDDAGIQCVHQHFDGLYQNQIIWNGTRPVVILLKDKEEIRKSWAKRYKTGKAHGKRFEMMWEEMHELINSEQEVFIIHIDDESVRDSELAAIGERVGKTITPDWSLRLGANGA